MEKEGSGVIIEKIMSRKLKVKMHKTIIRSDQCCCVEQK